MKKDIIGETPAPSKAHIQSNSLCFIDRLPTETLEDIFIQSACNYYSTASGHPISSAPKWVNVSYVSRYWRDVALNCAILWTYLFNTSPRWTEELLIRSKQAPLKFYMVWIGRDERPVRFLEQVMNHVERFQEAGLSLSPSTYHLLSKLSSSAPLLQVLCLSWGNPLERTRLLFGGNVLHIPSHAHPKIPWYSLKYFSRLTNLSLFRVPPDVQQNTEEFLTMLRSLQDLTHLCLDSAFPSSTVFLSSKSFHAFQKISLPHLSHVSISDRISTVIALLSCMDIPWKAKLKLSCDCSESFPSGEPYASLNSLFAQRVGMYSEQAPYSKLIGFLSISSSWQTRAHIAFGTLGCNHLLPGDTGWESNSPLQISYSIPWGSWERLASCISCPALLSSVQKVQVSHPTMFQAFWTDILGQLPDLRCLELRRGRMPHIAPLLSLVPYDAMQSQSGPPRVYAPALEALMLENIQFSVLPKGASNVPDMLRDPTRLSLYDALSTRKDARIRMTMVRCNERGPDVPKSKLEDMAGWWEGGRFSVDR